MRLFLDTNVHNLNGSYSFMGYKLVHYVDGASDNIFDQVKDLINAEENRNLNGVEWDG